MEFCQCGKVGTMISLGTFTVACTYLLVTIFTVPRQNLQGHNDLFKNKKSGME